MPVGYLTKIQYENWWCLLTACNDYWDYLAAKACFGELLLVMGETEENIVFQALLFGFCRHVSPAWKGEYLVFWRFSSVLWLHVQESISWRARLLKMWAWRVNMFEKCQRTVIKYFVWGTVCRFEPSHLRPSCIQKCPHPFASLLSLRLHTTSKCIDSSPSFSVYQPSLSILWAVLPFSVFYILRPDGLNSDVLSCCFNTS